METITFKILQDKYTASFTAGALLFEETDAVIKFFQTHSLGDSKKLIESNEFLKINSINSRKRRVQEILKRIETVPIDYWEFYNNLTTKDEKKVFLYFVCLKKYILIRDFHLEIVINKWRLLDSNLNKADILRFLKWASEKHPEIDEWTASTIDKIAQIIILMLKETNLLLNGKLKKVHLNQDFWPFFWNHGESWFLEAMLLSKEEREISILK